MKLIRKFVSLTHLGSLDFILPTYLSSSLEDLFTIEIEWTCLTQVSSFSFFLSFSHQHSSVPKLALFFPAKHAIMVEYAIFGSARSIWPTYHFIRWDNVVWLQWRHYSSRGWCGGRAGNNTRPGSRSQILKKSSFNETLSNLNLRFWEFLKGSRPVVMGDPPEIQLVPECRNCTGVKENLR